MRGVYFASFLGLCGKVLMGVFFGTIMFLGVIEFGIRRFLNAKIGYSRCGNFSLPLFSSLKCLYCHLMHWHYMVSKLKTEMKKLTLLEKIFELLIDSLISIFLILNLLKLIDTIWEN